MYIKNTSDNIKIKIIKRGFYNDIKGRKLRKNKKC